MQGTHIRKVVPHAGLPGVFVFDPSYAHWIENTSEASRSSCDISATSLPWLGYLGLFLTDRCIWSPGAGWDADLLLPLLPSRDFRGVWQYGQDLIGNAEFNMLWLSSFHFLYNVLYIMYICVFLPTGIYQKCWRTNDGWLFDEQQYIWEFPKIGVLQIIQNSTHGFRMNWEPLFWGSTMLGNPHLVTCITRTLLDPRRCPVLGHPWSCRRWNAMRCCCWRNWWRCFRAAVWPECSVETWLVALVAGCEFHPQN